MTVSCVCRLRIEQHPPLTVRLANRYIIRSLRCRIGDAVSPEGVGVGLGEFTRPLDGEGFVGRWVRGLVPWVHAVLAGCFLQGAKSALGQAQTGANVSRIGQGKVRQLDRGQGARAV